MRTISLICLLIWGSIGSAQTNDSLSGSDSISIIHNAPIFAPHAFMDCNHSHACCAIHCSCCSELQREQFTRVLHDTIVNGVQRTTYGERYSIAQSYSLAPMYFKFYKDGKPIGKYYSTERPIRSYSRFERYVWNYDSLDHRKEYQLVFDSLGAHHLINWEGEKQSIDFQHRFELSKNVFLVSIPMSARQNSLSNRIYGLETAGGEPITKLMYSSIQPLDNNQFIVSRNNVYPGRLFEINLNGRVELIDANGNSIFKKPVEAIEYLGDGYFKIVRDRRYYLANDKGEILTEGYKRLGNPSEGFISFRENEKMGFLKLDGTTLVEANYDWASDFSEGMAAVTKRDENNVEKWGYIDSSGKEVIALAYDQARNFSDGIAAVAIGRNSNTDTWLFINTTGKRLNFPTFDNYEGTKDGVHRIFVNGSGDGLITTRKKEILAPHYDIIGYGIKDSWFTHDRLFVRDYQDGANKLYWMNEKGEVVKDFTEFGGYIRNLNQINGGLPLELPPLFTAQKDHKMGVIDLNGDLVIPMKYESIRYWFQDYLLLQKEKKFWSYNIQTKEKIFLGEGEGIPNFDGTLGFRDANYTFRYVNYKGESMDSVVPK